MRQLALEGAAVVLLLGELVRLGTSRCSGLVRMVSPARGLFCLGVGNSPPDPAVARSVPAELTLGQAPEHGAQLWPKELLVHPSPVHAGLRFRPQGSLFLRVRLDPELCANVILWSGRWGFRGNAKGFSGAHSRRAGCSDRL